MSGPSLVDQTDLAILNALQDDLPLVSRPWKAIADRLDISETDMIDRMKNLEESGIIRDIPRCLNPALSACMLRHWYSPCTKGATGGDCRYYQQLYGSVAQFPAGSLLFPLVYPGCTE